MPLPNIPRGGPGGMPAPKPPERPQPLLKPKPPEPPKAPPKPFEKTYYIPPKDFLGKMRTNPNVYKIAGGSSSALNELLKKMESEIDFGSSLTEQKIIALQGMFKKKQSDAIREGDLRNANIAGKASDLLGRFRKGEL